MSVSGITIVTAMVMTCFGFFPSIHGLKNVLFLIADDLRPEMSSYYEAGSQLYPNIHTPSLDSLASKSLVLKKAYVQYPLCAPSRTSFMTGRRPDTTRVYNLEDYWRTVGGNYTTIPGYFKSHGYHSASVGKIFHQGTSSGDDNDARSWTEPHFDGTSTFENSKKSWKVISDRKLRRKNKKLIDEQIADEAISLLNAYASDAKSGSKQFFLAVGFKKPHLPFVSPKSIMEAHYPKSDVFLPTNPYVPAYMPSVAWKKWGELRAYDDIRALNVDGSENATLPDRTVRELRRAYYSCVTWMDKQLGRVIDEVTALGLENDTIISLVGDHGFLLGEHGGWSKQALFELATHAPMMVHVPGVTNQTITTNELVEFVDLLPTIVEASSLPLISQCPENSTGVQMCSEGTSLLPLASDPNTPIRNASFSQQKRNGRMGYSIRTAIFRYTEWVQFDSQTLLSNWNVVTDVELYNLAADPDENINVASRQAYNSNVAVLSHALRAGWRAAPQGVPSKKNFLILYNI